MLGKTHTCCCSAKETFSIPSARALAFATMAFASPETNERYAFTELEIELHCSHEFIFCSPSLFF